MLPHRMQVNPDEHARQANAKTPPPGHGETAQACLELERQDPAGD
jgi:hypothetical protein